MRCVAGFLCISALFAQAPPTAKRPVTDTYHGVSVVDDYRWLEDFSDPAVKSWSAAQNRYARQVLDGLPERAVIADELKALYAKSSRSYSSMTSRSGLLFALERQPGREQPLLVTLTSPDNLASERVVLDPNRIDVKGGTEIDFYVPSHDGKRVAVSLSRGGSESGDLHIYDVGTGKQLDDPIARVNNGTAGGSVAWNGDGTGFYYTRYPRRGERPAADLDFYQQVYFHRIGANAAGDAYSLGKGFPKIAEIALDSSPDGRYVLASMAFGDGGEFAHYLLGPHGDWTQVAHPADEVSEVKPGGDGYLYLLSRHNAPMGKILRTPLDHPDLSAARTVAPESASAAIQDIVATAHRLYTIDQAGNAMQVHVFDTAGGAKGLIPLPPVSSVLQIVGTAGDEVLVKAETFLEPPAWFRFNPASGELKRTALYQPAPADSSDTEVVVDFAASKDGARIPLSIIRRKDTVLDGNNPVVLYGYGGYSVSLSPRYSVTLRPLLARHVVYVYANLRGGGEYGEAWHRAGMLTRKQNVFDDFTAAAQWLIQHRYTIPARLGIEGGSNGGLLMGAALTQHPELFGAVVSHVGIYDMLRVELFPTAHSM